MTDDRMPSANSPILGAAVTAVALILVIATCGPRHLRQAWIDTQARIQALGFRLGDAMDQIGIYDGELDE